VLLVFAAPVLLALFLQSGWSSHSPEETTNHGLLLDPPVPVNGWRERVNAVGRPLWTLLVHSRGDCVASCREHLDWLQQLRLALGRHADQLALGLIAPDSDTLGALVERGAVDEVHLLDGGSALSVAVELAASENPGEAWETLLIDPRGFIVLRYAERADITGMRKDIDRLIRQSNKARGLN
jgi:hypothetical protein